MPPNPRVIKAFRAMRDIGIDKTKVKPVLKRLLNLYEKNWELIEAEDYRALADAIFEEEDAKGPGAEEVGGAGVESANGGNMEEEPQDHDEPERPLKRLRKGLTGHVSSSPDNCSSLSIGGPLITPKEEKEELIGMNYTQQSPDTRSSQSLVISPHNLATNMGKQAISPTPLVVQQNSNPHVPLTADRTLPPNSLSPQKVCTNKGKEPLVPQIASKEKGPVLMEASSGSRCKDHVVNPHNALVPKENVHDALVNPHNALVPKEKVHDTLALIIPKDEPFTDDMALCELPLSVIPHASSSKEDSSIHVASKGKPDGIHEEAPGSSSETRDNCNAAIMPEESPAILEIATSLMGEVKISLSCNSIVGRPNFHMPSQEELLKSLEEKCLRSYKIIDPNFSVMKMLKDMCEWFLELATDPSHKSQERLLNVTPTGNILKQVAVNSSLGGVIGNACLSANTSNESVGISHVDGVAAPETPVLSVDGLHDKLSGQELAAEDYLETKKGNELRDTKLCGLVAVPQCHTPDRFKSLEKMNDMTKGEEAVEIPWLNEINDEYPPSFNYIPGNLVFQNANVNFTLSQITAENCCTRCVGDCLSSATPCVCSSESIHGFAYTQDGLVKEDFLDECISMNLDPRRQSHSYCRDCPIQRAKGDGILQPCNGHLKRKYIKECWRKCGCHKLCGNRVVQRGIRCKLQVFFTSEGKGWGLRTLENLPKGTFVCEYVGEILTTKEFFERKMEMVRNKKKHACPAPLDAYWSLKDHLKDEDALCLDATCHGNVARFINHRCLDANLIEIPVKIEIPDHHYYHLAFFTTREVKALEELTLDYGIDFDDDENNDTVDAFQCLCGSKFCRDIRRSNRSRHSTKRCEA